MRVAFYTEQFAAGTGAQKKHRLFVHYIIMEILLGAFVSLIVQAIKSRTGGEYSTLAALAVLSLCAAGLYTALVAAGYWETVYQVLLTAGAFYAFVIQRFEAKDGPQPTL